MSQFGDLVVKELKKARAGHKDLNSCHEAYAVLLEEVYEFFDEVRKKRAKRDLKNMLKELVQIATVAQRAAEDLQLLEE